MPCRKWTRTNIRWRSPSLSIRAADVYVRRINVAGNTRTRDEVIRREMRQMESGWYDNQKIKRSKERLDLLGYFTDVNVETPAVTDTPDQVDVNVSVTENPPAACNWAPVSRRTMALPCRRRSRRPTSLVRARPCRQALTPTR